VGKKADLVLFDTKRPEWRNLFNPVNTLVYNADGRSVHTVIVDGRVVVQTLHHSVSMNGNSSKSSGDWPASVGPHGSVFSTTLAGGVTSPLHSKPHPWQKSWRPS
jgi:hypothetical protein